MRRLMRIRHFPLIKLAIGLIFSILVIAQSAESPRISNNQLNIRSINGVALPFDFPDIHVNKYSNETAPGKIFFGSTFLDTGIGNYLVICENDGTPFFFRKFPRKSDGRGSGEFQLQPTGVLTAYLFEPEFYIAFDTTFTIVDTFQCGNGYQTDPHELTITPEGHALLIANEYKTVDMSKIVDGGNPNATVIGNHIQELDINKNIIFEWNCWEHMKIEDAIHENLRASSIDYMHMNAVSVDYDGHLIVSCRHLSEISKINRHTGEFMWRFGGVNNQFRFINENLEFSYQHYVRPVPGKPNYYTLFDNGNYRNPQFSRAVEYKLNPISMTAEKTWEFRYEPDRYIFMLGSVQRFENQNTMINWSTWPPLFANEVDFAGNILYEFEVEGISSNRVRRYQWNGVAKKPYLVAEAHDAGVVLIFNKFGDKDLESYIVYGGTSPTELVAMDITDQTFSYITELENTTTYYFKVCALYSDGRRSDFSDLIDIFVNLKESGENLLFNGDFDSNEEYWNFLTSGDAGATGSVQEGAFTANIESGGSELYNVQLVQENLPIIQGEQYRFEFDAWAESNRIIEPKVAQNGGEYINYSQTTTIALKRANTHYTFDFEMTNPSDTRARVVFNFGLSDVNCYIDNVSLIQLTDTKVQSMNSVDTDKLTQIQNAPNPFNTTTTIHFVLEQGGAVTLRIYNVLGKLVVEQNWPNKPSGRHAFTIDASDWSSGIYFYRLQIVKPDGHSYYSEPKKMMLIK